MKMLLTGDRIDAAEAYRLGMVSDLVAPDALDAVSLEVAERIASNGPLAVRAIKETASRARNLPLSESIPLEQLMWGVLRDTADRLEGRAAFTEKRAPRFRGE
jgi:E-phenylitaconyl-CoA hydratase